MQVLVMLIPATGSALVAFCPLFSFSLYPNIRSYYSLHELRGLLLDFSNLFLFLVWFGYQGLCNTMSGNWMCWPKMLSKL